MKKLILFALLGSPVSCGDDKQENSAPTDKTALITAKNWRLTASTLLESGKTTPTDEYALMSDCEKDNFVRFSADKEFTINEGATKCNSNAPQSETSTWRFNSDQTKILSTDPGLGFPISADIVELTNSTLKVRYSLFGDTTSETYTAFEAD